MVFLLLISLSFSYKPYLAVQLSPHEWALLTEGREVYLKIYPHPGDGYIHIKRRYLHPRVPLKTLRAFNKNRPFLLKGFPFYLPYHLLKDPWKVKVIRALYPKDRHTSQGWEHRVVHENLWRIGELFTGEGKNYRILREFNNLISLEIQKGQIILIPEEILLPPLKEIPRVPPSASVGELTYQGDYAIYHLKKGEALYSSVVVRFTGNIHADDVNALAKEYARLSGIQDVTRIPVHYPIRIPMEDLLPQYLPPGHPRRQAWEKKLLESVPLATRIKAESLMGIHIILDAGHGGVDTGTIKRGIWESTYVYDILCRVKKLLETQTQAQVHPLIRDKKRGYTIPDKNRLTQHKKQILLTRPPYDLSNPIMGVNLRGYLTASIFQELLKAGVGKDQVVFLSFHADALHPSISGATIYYPGADYYEGGILKRSGSYSLFHEVKQVAYIHFSQKDRLRAEAKSREFSRTLLDTFERFKLPVHRYGPLRDSIIRRRRRWVPAVLRENPVPTRVLVEVGNLNNAKDRKNLLTTHYRQKIAEAVVTALLNYFGYKLPEEHPPLQASNL